MAYSPESECDAIVDFTRKYIWQGLLHQLFTLKAAPESRKMQSMISTGFANCTKPCPSGPLY
jgi:hypothetical protein